jgi:transposase-like protein
LKRTRKINVSKTAKDHGVPTETLRYRVDKLKEQIKQEKEEQERTTIEEGTHLGRSGQPTSATVDDVAEMVVVEDEEVVENKNNQGPERDILMQKKKKKKR